ncbi:bifunctional helix-turn-helix transcriptional regulator/GNAT family N-acetyltransferase [Pseudomarimonas salicorniae]|uniref:Bifunctional helix-turn-helix transcriptional regulator/GNAT family N-acetyltransferase n=1 Tax=Pseudomarimonas salicorniae TaxID=2933270 RepID=A0ABT0GJ08_9GAMM|nr:GNAT family N-acetyltransferase [Lysobacter sp. CAU 1642]MCK7594529.1 bifunctional helix-turn-helix transcriptional regulator/GNAT family N-acetyltransferase [Lysobacter sp. CAU 1642]
MKANCYGELALGSRLRALSDRLFDAVDEVYHQQGAGIQSRWFLLLRVLLDEGPMPVSELAAALGQSHAAVSQLSRKLQAEGLLERRSDPEDARRSVLALSAEGERRLQALQPLWASIREAVGECIARSGHPLLDAVSALEAELDRTPLADAINREQARRRAAEVRIVPFEAAYRGDFYRLNAEWLTRYFCIEEIDHRVLSQPETEILQPGGSILFALLGHEVIGTCALLPDGEGRFELTKMAVTASAQGLGIGRKLLVAAIEEFKRLGGTELFLESHSSLGPALALYQSLGFERMPTRRPGSHYQRSDVYMIWPSAQASRAA